MTKHKPNPRSRIAANLARAMATCPGLNSQAALARRSGVGQTTIGRILRSEAAPSAEVLRKLAHSLNVPAGNLIEDEPKDKTELEQPSNLNATLIADTYTGLQWQFALQGLEYDPVGSAQILVHALRWALDSSPANRAALDQAIQIATAQGANNSFKPKPLRGSA